MTSDTNRRGSIIVHLSTVVLVVAAACFLVLPVSTPTIVFELLMIGSPVVAVAGLIAGTQRLARPARTKSIMIACQAAGGCVAVAVGVVAIFSDDANIGAGLLLLVGFALLVVVAVSSSVVAGIGGGATTR